MSKYLIETVSIKKYQYIIEAYSKNEAIEKGPYHRHIDEFDMGQHIFIIRPLNEYEYNKDWKEMEDTGPEDVDLEALKDDAEKRYFNYGGTNGDL